MFRFSWKDSSHLTIEMPDYYEKEIKKIGEWHGVTVEYVSKRPNVLRETNSPDGKFRALLYDLGCGGGRVVLIRGVNEDIGNPIIGENGKNAHVGWIKDGMKVNFQWLGKKVLKITTNESVNNVVAPKTEYMEIRVDGWERAQNEGITEELGFGLIRWSSNNPNKHPNIKQGTPINQSKESMRAGLISWGNQGPV
jgi:hypothetical protein